MGVRPPFVCRAADHEGCLHISPAFLASAVVLRGSGCSGAGMDFMQDMPPSLLMPAGLIMRRRTMQHRTVFVAGAGWLVGLVRSDTRHFELKSGKRVSHFIFREMQAI